MDEEWSTIREIVVVKTLKASSDDFTFELWTPTTVYDHDFPLNLNPPRMRKEKLCLSGTTFYPKITLGYL